MSEELLKEPQTPDDLADAFAEAVPLGTFDVDLPGGRVLKFRYPTRYGEIREFNRGLVEFWNMWANPDDLLEELKGLEPQDWAEAYAAYLVYFWAAPENRFSQRGALTLLKNPWVMDSIRRQIETMQKATVDGTALKEIDDAKKESPETTSTEPVSGSAETPSESTPTN